MLLAGIFFALMNVSVKFIPHIPAIEIILFRSLFSLIFSYAILKQQKVPVFGNNKKLLVLRGVVGSVGLITFFYTLQKIPLASAVTIQYLSPIFTTILGIFLVKERVKPIQFLFFAISFAGVLVVQGFDSRVNLFYAAIGVTSAIFSGLAYNVIRKLKNTEHPLVIIFYFPLVTLPIATVVSYFTWVQPVGWDWAILLWIGICTQTAQYFMTVAYQNANVAKVSSMTYLGLLYALFFGFLLFGETFGTMSYVGMGLVLLGILLNLRVK
ncbi:DMT family transporter [Algoriphagus zhangzhouensis]|uniref:EamA domain-containing membrane protein RarD n=1 Tax=Algoriphagus zhangzhouensis TaxID=1073327 RepID=A0A1M7Z3J3_9BACT|nr:DMT family transporter [Algoriphagus zhangzhouensis]TDY48461.1 EamA domain-containing membrane protein RarD [Algoriphagus zhangzhouensis]SHO59508.1 EamA domain-containing membrane protein RarD [Algoriphagus zhangzhouensis]